MSLTDEAMRWLYAASLRPGVFLVDAAVAGLLALFVVASWRLGRAVLRRRADGTGTRRSRGRLLRLPTRPDAARMFGGVGTDGRPVHTPSAPVLAADRRSSAGFPWSGSRS